jgi:hypothetical protein
LNAADLKQFARVGAQARLAQLELEKRAILEMFPDLRGHDGAAPARRGGRRRSKGRKSRKAADKPSRRAPKMSAAARKAASERMKKYWADRKKAKTPETGAAK